MQRGELRSGKHRPKVRRSFFNSLTRLIRSRCRRVRVKVITALVLVKLRSRGHLIIIRPFVVKVVRIIGLRL